MPTIQVKQTLKKDSAINWANSNPTLLDGEVGWDTTNKKAKVGNGVTGWNSLPYTDDAIFTALDLKEPLIKNTTVETEVVDGDKIPFTDVSDGGNTKEITWTNIKLTLKTYFDTLYNKYTHPTTAGNKHIPTGGTVGQILKNTASGTATWQADNDTVTTINGKTGAIAKEDITALGIPAQDTVYSHPTTHPSSIIEQDASNRFVTDAEKSTWNGKQNALGYTPVNKAGDTIAGQLAVESATFPVVDIVRNSSGTGGSLYGGARLQRKTTDPVNGVGIGFYFQAPNSNKAMTHAGMFGGALGTINAGSEKGEIVLSPSYAGQDPYARRDFIVRAISASKAEAELNGKLRTEQTLASDPTNTVATKKYVDDNKTIEYTHPATHPSSMITGLPTSLPADGGDADTVNGFTVGVNVPAGAKFTDTIYAHPTTAGNKHIPTDGASGQILRYSASGTAIWGADNDTITTINGKTGVIAKGDITALGIPAQDTVYTHPTGSNPHGTTKADVGLGSVDNTSDIDKSVSTATQNLIDLSSVPFVVGTQTVTTASWTGVLDTLDDIYDGLTIRYWLPRTSASNVTLNLTLKGGTATGNIPCYYSNSTRLTTQYAAGNIIVLTYVEGKLANGVSRTGWYAHAQYNTSYSIISETEIDAGTATSRRVITAQRLKYITDKIQTLLNGKVDNSQVLTDVPENAKFTDTVYTHPSTAGNKHIPTGGASGQVLKYSASGTAAWGADDNTITTVNGKTGAIVKADIVALGIPAQDTVYTHPTNDGNLHVPATSTTNNGKVLTAGATAGNISWQEIAGGAEAISLTKAEYDSLEIKDPDTYYYITDELVSAISVLYTNANSGMAASQVQAAIDELNSKIGELEILSTEVANLKRTPTIFKTGNFSFSLVDETKFIKCSSLEPIVATLRTNVNVSFPLNAEIVVSRDGEGEVTITPESGVTLNNGTEGIAISSQYGAVTLKQSAINNWTVIGAI